MVNVNALHKYGILSEYTHAAGVAQANNAVERGGVTYFGDDEAFQIDKIEVFPPVGAMPFPIENILVQLIVDNDTIDTIFLDSRMANPYAVGTPPFKPSCYMFGERKSTNPLENYCLKGRKSLQIKTMGLIGGVAITSSYYVRVSGDWFKTDDALRNFFGPTFNPVPVTVEDGVRDRRVTVFRPIPISLDNWLNLSGGCHRSAKPRVLPWVNFCRNAVDTTPNTEMPLDLRPGNVTYEWENMHWDLDSQTYIINDYIGVWPDEVGQHLRTVWWEYGGVEYPQPIIPTGVPRWDTRFNFNELPPGMPPHSGILNFHGPRQVDRKLLGTKEIMELRMMDDGTAVHHTAADHVFLAQWSRKIEF